MERRLTTIVAADLVGYSRLMSDDEEGTLNRFKSARAAIIEPELKLAGARLIKTMGDGLLVEFSSPVAAVRTSLAIQNAMITREADAPEAQKLKFRIGINLGDVVIDGDDILGDGVNIAARLESLAPPGGICISRAVHDQLRGKIPQPMTAIGLQSVKNIPDPVDVWRVEVEGVLAVDAPASQATERPSIAVLPFENMSSDAEQEYLADGIVEDVIMELARFRSIFVIARNSTFSYKGTHKDVREIAAELGVRYVVEGSVRRAGDRLRVSAQLIEGTTGNHLWAERWDRTMADLFDVQDELTRAIIDGIEPELGAHERATARRKPTESLTAWELYQRAYSEYVSDDEMQSYENCFDYLTAAIKADPDFALPHALLARWYFYHIVSGLTKGDRDAFVQAGLFHADASVHLDNRLPLAFAGQGLMLMVSGRMREAGEALDKAETLSQNEPVLYFARGVWHQFQSDPDAWEKACLMGLKLSPKDPLQWVHYWNLGHARYVRHFDLTDPSVREAYETAASFHNADYHCQMFAALAALAQGDLVDARHYVAKALKRYPEITLKNWISYDTPHMDRFLRETTAEQESLIALGLPRG